MYNVLRSMTERSNDTCVLPDACVLGNFHKEKHPELHKRYQQQQLTSSIMNNQHTHTYIYEYVAFHVHIQYQVTTTTPSSYESLQISQKN